MLFLTRGGSVWRKTATAATATALAATTLAFASAPAQAADEAVTNGALVWGLSPYLNSSNMGRPNPLATAYVAPASFDASTMLSTFGGATGTVDLETGADVVFDGTSVNFAKTGGAWLKLTDPAVEVDEEGNGVLSAEVAYGTAPGTFPNIVFDPAQPPLRPAERVDVVTLAGNTAADVSAVTGQVSYTGLDGTWAAEFIDFLDGDATADPVVPGFIYAGQINNADVEEDGSRLPAPLSFTVAAPSVYVGSPDVTAVAAVEGADVAFNITASNVEPDATVTSVPSMAKGVYVAVSKKRNIFESTGSIEEETAENLVMNFFPKEIFVDRTLQVKLRVPKAKLVKGATYAVYTWTAHGNPNPLDSQYTETVVQVPAAAFVTPKVASKTTVKVNKVPTTKKAGKATIKVTGKQGAATGKVTFTLKKGKATKKVKAAKLKKGKVVVKLPKLKKGKWKLTAKYAGNGSYKASKKTVTVKVKR